MVNKATKYGILIVLGLLLVGVCAGAASAGPTVVTTEQELKNAFIHADEIVLGADITTSAELVTTHEVKLDLAGHVLKASGKHRLFRVDNYDSLTLYDSSPEGKGKVTGGHIVDKGGCVYVCKRGWFILKGGTIEDCYAECSSDTSSEGSGGCVYLEQDANFRMEGGTIKNCRADDYGGAVYIKGGSFIMSGGTIYGCIAHHMRGIGGEGGHFGGAVHVNSDGKDHPGEFTMNSGTIEKCMADACGGGVYVGGEAYDVGFGTFIMNGGQIKDCDIRTSGTQDEGGGVYLEGENCIFKMNGGSISGCHAEDYGGGVFVDDMATFYMYGGTINGCWVDDDDGGGVYVDDASPGFRDGEIHISGNAIVVGNSADGEDNDVYLEADDLLFLDGDFTGCIGISNQDGKFGVNNGHIGAGFFFKNPGQSVKGMNSGSDMKFGESISEFKDLTPATGGLVTVSGPITDTSKIYEVGNPVRLLFNPLIINAGDEANPVTIRMLNDKARILSVPHFDYTSDPVIIVNMNKHLTLTGKGSLSDGHGKNGGGIYLDRGSHLIMDGITISDCSATENGGGIYADEDTSVTISDGTIEKCDAGVNGGGIYSKGISVSMLGGEIKENTAGAKGSGMYVSAQTSFNVGNKATVAENKKGKWEDNVYLESSDAINLFGSLNGKIGIGYAGGVPAAGNQFGFAPSAMSSGAENFVADGKNLEGKISDKKLVWIEKRVATTVTFDPKGGTVSPSSKKVFEGEPYGILPIPVRASYAFAGWYPNAQDPWGTEITKDTKVPQGLGSTQTLYAKWRGPIVTVTFDPKGGTVFPTSKQVVYNEKYGELPIPVRDDGWSFAGWYPGPDGTGDKITQDTTVTAEVAHTLYAKWMQLPVKVSFKPNGVEFKETLSPKDVYTGKPYGDAIQIPEPNDPDYTFVGWYLDSACTGAKVTKDTIVKATENHDLYAKWFGPIIVSNTNIDFGTVFKGDPIPTLTDMVYTDLDETVTLTFPSGDFGFSKSDTGEELSGTVTIPKNTQYSFTITPSSTATEGFYSADIPITKDATPLGNLSVTMSVVAKNLKNDGKASVPTLPIVYNLIDAGNSSVAWLVGVEGESNLVVDESTGTARISFFSNNADIPELQITDVERKQAYAPTAIKLSADSSITARYPSKNLENKYRNPAGTYSVELGLTDVLRNLPTFIGTFNESLTQVIAAMGYTPVAMVSPVNGKDALDTMNLLVKDDGVEVTFTVPVKQLPKSIILAEAVSVFSVDADGNVLVAPVSASQVGDDYVVTAHVSSLSSYVLAFDASKGYYGITPLEGWHGDIDPDYLYHKAGDTVSVTPVPDVDYEYRALLVYNESWSLYTVTTGTTFSMPAEHVYLYGVFAEEAPTTCRVSFDMNGHGVQIDSQTVNIGEKAKKPADPTASGYAFVGWFSDIALLIPYDFDTPVTDDIELHAKWTEASANRGHSASIPKDYTPSSSVPQMVQETAKPTTTPTIAVPTMMPTTKPTTQATTSKSPAPLAGLIAGLGAAALLIRMRR